jgi:hypothetical protein
MFSSAAIFTNICQTMADVPKEKIVRQIQSLSLNSFKYSWGDELNSRLEYR